MIIFNEDPTINPFNEFLKSYGIWFAIAIAGLVLLAVLVLVFISLSKKKSTLNEEPQIIDNSGVIKALGGSDNILSHSLNGSRIVLELKDYSLVDEKSLNELGVNSIIKMSNKITLVIKGDSNSFYKSVF